MKRTGICRQSPWRLLLHTLVATLLTLCSAHLFGEVPVDIMEVLYDLREADSLKPYEHKISGSDAIDLFPVPFDGSVGTNKLDNAITVFSFHGSRMSKKNYFRNAMSEMGGDCQYMPVVSKDMIGYGQKRAFSLFDFANRKHQEHFIVKSLEHKIIQIRTANAEKKQFLSEIQESNPKSQDWKDYDRFLRLMDLSGESPSTLKEVHVGKTKLWQVNNDQVFLCEFEENDLQVYTLGLEPAKHPLVDIIKKNKGKADFMMVMPHPTLPFAVFFGGGHRAQYVCWNQTFRDEKLKSIFGGYNQRGPSTLFYTFSPDGKWVVFWADEMEPKRSYIMPISDKYPNYLGSPILLEGGDLGRYSFAWTTNPVGLAGSVHGGKIVYFDLTKEGHPETGDKPTFWDYVVDRDLERLRKAGKQGLKLKP